MDSFQIYLSGGMSGLTQEEQLKWRNQIENAINYGEYDLSVKPVFFSPPKYYAIDSDDYKTEREAMDYDLYKLRSSNMVIVNFNVPNSLGTAMELMLARELHIPVIGLNKDGVELHPWLVECCTRICSSTRELVNHVVHFYLN